MKSKIKLCLIFLFFSLTNCKLREFVKWRNINYMNLPTDAFYDPYVNVPFGIAHYRNKLFVGVARRSPGVPSTLNIAVLNGKPPHINPLLTAYPNYAMNTLNPLNTANPSKIVSVYRPRVDRCDRLWFVDTGVLEYPDNQINVQRPSIWTIDLRTDEVIRRFEIPRSVVPDGKGLSTITIDDDDCENSFAYLADWFNNILIVFSAFESRAWRFNHNYFYFNPFEGDFSVDGLQFHWNDGIFSVALSGTKPNGYRTAFFHPLASNGEFTVSTEILRNEQYASRRSHGQDFKFLGQRGFRSQAGTHCFDLSTNVIFFADMQKDSISCWNIRDPLKPSNIHLVQQDNSSMIYPTDLDIDKDDSMLYVLSNRLPRFIYDRYDSTSYNFNIFRGNINAALAGTSCL